MRQAQHSAHARAASRPPPAPARYTRYDARHNAAAGTSARYITQERNSAAAGVTLRRARGVARSHAQREPLLFSARWYMVRREAEVLPCGHGKAPKRCDEQVQCVTNRGPPCCADAFFTSRSNARRV